MTEIIDIERGVTTDIYPMPSFTTLQVSGLAVSIAWWHAAPRRGWTGADRWVSG